MRIAEILAREYGVSASTIKRAGKLALEVEADPELQEAIRVGIPIKKILKERRKPPGSYVYVMDGYVTLKLTKEEYSRARNRALKELDRG